MNTTTTSARSLTDTAAALSDLIEQGARLSLDLFESLRTNSMSMMNDVMSPSTVNGLLPQLKTMTTPFTGSCCEIPAPCWAPQAIGDVTCHVCPGGTATLRLRITNCGATVRNIKIELAGKLPGGTVTPPGLALGPMEREFVSVSVALPAETATGQEHELLIWVRGCQNHYLRWTLQVANRGASCCHEVEVEDCPDLIHHWYDHFYCERPCTH